MPDDLDAYLDPLPKSRRRGEVLSPDQIANTLRSAGWEERHIPTMTAIAQAESSGNPRAHNPKYPDDSYGLLQVNRLAHPQFSPETLRDPVGNARAGLDVFKRQGLGAWATYKSGAYKKYLRQSQHAEPQELDPLESYLDPTPTPTPTPRPTPRPLGISEKLKRARGGAAGIAEMPEPIVAEGGYQRTQPGQPGKPRRQSLADALTALPGVHQIINLLPEEERENIVEGAVGAIGGTSRQLANAQMLNRQGRERGQRDATSLGLQVPERPFFPAPPISEEQLRSAARSAEQVIAENEAQRPAPTTIAGQIRRGVGKGLGGATIELPKLIGGGRVLGAANLPVQGALSQADEGIPGIIRGVAGGLVYHYGGQLTGKYLGKIGNSLVWIGGPTAEQQIEPRLRGQEAPPLARSIGENIPIGIFAGVGGAKRRERPEPVRVREGGTVRLATEADLPKITSREIEVVPPEPQAAYTPWGLPGDMSLKESFTDAHARFLQERGLSLKQARSLSDAEKRQLGNEFREWFEAGEGKRHARQVEAQPDVTAQPETEQREQGRVEPSVPGVAGRQLEATTERAVPDVEGAEAGNRLGKTATQPQRFYHKQFGEVEILPDQTGAGKNRHRVSEVANPDIQHFVKKSDLRGRGNERMVPVKVEEPVATAPGTDIEQYLEPEAKEVSRATQEALTPETETRQLRVSAGRAVPPVRPTETPERLSEPLPTARKRPGEAGFIQLGRPAPGPSAGPVLTEARNVIQEPPKPSRLSFLRTLPERFQSRYVAEFTPLRKLEAELYKGRDVPIVDMARKFEQVAGAPAKAEADIIDFRKNVTDPIRPYAEDFNAFLFLKRVESRLRQEPERKRVADWTIEKAQQGLNELEASIGRDTMRKFDEIGKVYQSEMRKALQLQVDSGRMTPELFQKIVESNDFYAPFKVLRYIEETEGLAGAGRRIATTQALSKKITGIDSEDFKLGNILQASAEQIVRSRILAEKNLKMNELAKLSELDTSKNLIVKVPQGQRARPGYEIVHYLEDGKPRGLEVAKDVAKAVQGLNAAQAGDIGKMAMMGRRSLQWGATSANAAFQAVNLFFADLPRASLVSRYGVRSARDIYQFPMDWVYSLTTSMKGNFGRPNELFMQWLRSGAANSTIQRELTPEAFKPEPLGVGKRRPAKAVLDSVAKFSNAIEETTKILGLKRGMRAEGFQRLAPEQQKAVMEKIAAEVRNYSGSPDFLRKGSETRGLNLLFMFFNARVQGTASDIARLAGKTGTKEGAAAWARMGVAVGIPTTLLAIVNSLPGYKEDYDKVPEWERDNYFMIPRESFFTNEDTGERVRDYWRVPKRELVKLFANTIESGVRFAYDRDAKHAGQWGASMIENLSPINIEGKSLAERGESVLGGVNPLIKVPYEIGTNRDLFRRREIVPQYMQKAEPSEQYRESTPRGYVVAGKALGVSPLKIGHAMEGLTGGGLGQFSIREPQLGRSPLTQYPVLRRFVRSGQVADEAGMGERIQKEERQESTEQVERRRNAIRALNSWRGLTAKEMDNRVASIAQRDPKLAEKITEMRADRNKGLTFLDKQILQLGIESGARQRFIESEMARMATQAERDAFLTELKNKGLLPKSMRGGRPSRPSRPSRTTRPER